MMDMMNDFLARSLMTIPDNYDAVIIGHQLSYPIDDTSPYGTSGSLNAWIHFFMIIDAYKKKSYTEYRCRNISAHGLSLLLYPKLVYQDFARNGAYGQYRKYDFGSVEVLEK